MKSKSISRYSSPIGIGEVPKPPGRHVKRNVPAMIEPRRQREPHLADDLRPQPQRWQRLAPGAQDSSGHIAAAVRSPSPDAAGRSRRRHSPVRPIPRPCRRPFPCLRSIDGPPCANLNAASGTAHGPSSPSSNVWNTRRSAKCGSARASAIVRTFAAGTWRPGTGFPLVGGLGFDDVGDNSGFALAVVDPRLVIGLDHVLAPHRPPEPFLLTDVAGADHHHALLGVIGAVGGERLLVAVRFRFGAVAEIAGHQRGLHHHRDAEHGEVDMLALAGVRSRWKRAAESAKAPIVPVA